MTAHTSTLPVHSQPIAASISTPVYSWNLLNSMAYIFLSEICSQLTLAGLSTMAEFRHCPMSADVSIMVEFRHQLISEFCHSLDISWCSAMAWFRCWSTSDKALAMAELQHQLTSTNESAMAGFQCLLTLAVVQVALLMSLNHCCMSIGYHICFRIG